MARHKYGKAFLVEPGVVGSLRGFVRSTGFYGKTMICLQIVQGTPHLFTEEVLGPYVLDASCKQVRTVWLASGAGRPSGALVDIRCLPEVVRSRYRLDGADFLAVQFVEPSYFKAFPSETW